MSKILFFSSTEFGAEILKTLHNSHYEIAGVVTRTDKIRGRGNKVISTPVKAYAVENDIDVYERDFVGAEDIDWMKNLEVDFHVVVAYGAIIPQSILDIPSIAPINIHASLLPKYRGASPIESAILNGEAKTGVSYMHMTSALDAGDVYKSFEIEIDENESFDSLNERLCELSKRTVVEALDKIRSGELEAVSQNADEVTYVGKILKEDAEIDFADSAINVKNKINALDSHIGAYAFIGDKRYKFFGSKISNFELPAGNVKTENGNIYIGTNDKAVVIDYIQAPGKKKMKTSDFLRGNSIEGRFEKDR